MKQTEMYNGMSAAQLYETPESVAPATQKSGYFKKRTVVRNTIGYKLWKSHSNGQNIGKTVGVKIAAKSVK